MTEKAPEKPATRSEKEIEADLAATRERLAGTVDELAFRAQPKEIAKREVEGARLKLGEMTHTSDGELDSQKLGFALGGVSAVLLTLGILRRARA